MPSRPRRQALRVLSGRRRSLRRRACRGARRSTTATCSSRGRRARGKTTIGSHLIVGLLKAGKRVGVTSNSHKVINNLLQAVERCAGEAGFTFSGAKKSTKDDPESLFGGRFIVDVYDNADIVGSPSAADRRHGVAVRRSGASRRARLPVRRRGRTGRARQPRRDGHGGAQHRAARRPDAARPADPGRASGPLGRVDARIPARRAGDGQRRPRHLPRHDVSHARGRLPLHLGCRLRRPPDAGARQPEPAAGAERRGARGAAADGHPVSSRSTHDGCTAKQQAGSRGRQGDLRKPAAAGATSTRRGGGTR